MAFPEWVSDTQYNNGVGIETLVLTSIAEIERVYSQLGIQLHTDDINPADLVNYDSNNQADSNKANFLTEVIQYVSSDVMSRLMPRYLIHDVYQIPLIRRIATYMAAHYISMRRGNEGVFEEEVIKGEEMLIEFREGTRFLDAPSNGQRAYMQSGVVDMRFSAQPWRVSRSASSTVISGQNQTWYYSFPWL